MSIEIETSGSTVEEAINIALEELGVERNDIEVEILDEPTKGFLGLGSHSARVKVRVKPEILTGVPVRKEEAPKEVTSAELTEEDRETLEAAERFVSGLLERMEIDGKVSVSMQEDMPHIDIDGEDMGLLIGRGGDTLASIQTLVSAHLSRHSGRMVYVAVDIQGYRDRKRESLEGLAERISERVAMSRKPYTMRPMPAAERRIIHMWVKEHPKVESSSEGVEPNRRVIIYPREG